MSWLGITLNCLTHLTFASSPLLRTDWVSYLDTWFGYCFPSWDGATIFWIVSGWMSLPLLVECLLEGAWYVYFCWFKLPAVLLFLLLLATPPILKQPFPNDIQLWIPSVSITLDITLFGRDMLPNYRKQH